LAVLFLIPAFSLAGLPPFSGFLGKTAVVTEGLDQRSWWIVAAAIAVSLMTLVSMLKIWSGAFWGAPDPVVAEAGHPGILRKHPMMATVTTAVVTLTLMIALFAGPLYRFCERAAIDVTDAASYPSAVLP
jgi:multicomponent Na+:H+ antiporter subunit D